VTCPRCGAAAAETQEYCLACGLRLPGRGRFGPVPLRQRRLVLPLLLTLAAAAGGAVAAIAATRDDAAAPPPIVATGGSVTIATPDTGPRLAVWPVGTDAWTIVLESFPKGTGAARADAESLATAARGRGLPRVGILDSGRFASMHPGYWIVFTGVYDTQPDANGALAQARAVVKTARVQRVAA
jgi:hypothetical protein